MAPIFFWPQTALRGRWEARRLVSLDALMIILVAFSHIFSVYLSLLSFFAPSSSAFCFSPFSLFSFLFSLLSLIPEDELSQKDRAWGHKNPWTPLQDVPALPCSVWLSSWSHKEAWSSHSHPVQKVLSNGS